MNKNNTHINQKLLEYQTLRLENLVSEIQKCCEYRRLYESKKFSLPVAELKCLMLFNGERYLTVKGIAQKLEVAKSRVTKLIQGLIDKGMVDRIEDPQDSRIKLISLTPSGAILSEEINNFKSSLHKKILMNMDPDERKSIISYLELLRSSMEAVKESMG
jgi:DNA-binding MarR family transcriptional regulator